MGESRHRADVSVSLVPKKPLRGELERGDNLLSDCLMPDELHELSDKELREKLASGELSEKKAQIARATLKMRRQERVEAWLKRHAWIGAILLAIGLAGIFGIGRRE